MAGSLVTTSLTFTDLTAGPNQPVVLPKTVLIPDVALVRGQVMARVTDSGKLDPYNSAGNDGTENPVGILMEDVAVSTADVEALIGFAGTYIKDNLTGIDDAAVIKLEARGIYVTEL